MCEALGVEMACAVAASVPGVNPVMRGEAYLAAWERMLDRQRLEARRHDFVERLNTARQLHAVGAISYADLVKAFEGA